jgi:polar amino acid transport system substrate-binding protein
LLRVGIRVWPEAEFIPPAFRDVSSAESGGALTGYEVDIARLVAEGLGLELELIEADPRIINSGDWNGQWDIALASLVPFDQPLRGTAAENIRYSVPYGYMPMGILIPVSEDSEVEIKTLADLAGRSVGVLEHSAHQRLLTPAELPLTVQGQTLMAPPPEGLQLIVVSNLPKTMRELALAEGQETAQLDAIFGPTPILEAAVEREFPVKLAAGAYRVGLQPLVIAAVPQDDLATDRLMAEINDILERSRERGLLAEIYFQWYREDFSEVP